MRHERTTAILCAVWLIAGCSRADPSLVPLGHGLLSRAERKAEADRPSPLRPEALHGSANPEGEPETVDVAVPLRSDSRSELKDGGTKPEADAADHSTPASKDGAAQTNLATIEDWLGVYRGNDITVFKMPEQSDRRFEDSKAKIRVERASKGHLTFALIDSSNDKDICTLSAAVEADTATVDAGQPCFLDSDESMTVKSRPGKATRRDRRLTFDLVLDTVLDSEMGRVGGTIEYHFEGQR